MYCTRSGTSKTDATLCDVVLFFLPPPLLLMLWNQNWLCSHKIYSAHRFKSVKSFCFTFMLFFAQRHDSHHHVSPNGLRSILYCFLSYFLLVALLNALDWTTTLSALERALPSWKYQNRSQQAKEKHGRECVYVSLVSRVIWSSIDKFLQWHRPIRNRLMDGRKTYGHHQLCRLLNEHQSADALQKENHTSSIKTMQVHHTMYG